MRAFVSRSHPLCRGPVVLLPAFRHQGTQPTPAEQPSEATTPSSTTAGSGSGGGSSGSGAAARSPTPTSASDETPFSAQGPSQPIRTLYPQVKLRARTQERPWQSSKTVAMTLDAYASEVDAPDTSAQASDTAALAVHSDAAAKDQQTVTAAPSSASSTTLPASTGAAASESTEAPNEVQQFLEAVRQQVEVARFERNQTIPFPDHPDTSAPLFRRVRRHKKLEVVVADPDFPTFQRRDHAVPLPPADVHPWVKRTPMGPHIIHGDGQINVHGGTGEVGFDDDADMAARGRPLPRRFRGLQHHSVIGRPLPQVNGKVLQDAVVRHSFALTGRGIFATRDVKKGETIMVVQSTAQNTGVKGEINRLEEMIVHILRTAHGGDVMVEDGEDGMGAVDVDEDAVREARAFLHDWVLTGQASSLMEYWPAAATQRVVDAIGGPQVLYDLELHQNHIARLAAILDLNSFLVESFYAERKGMAYFPEAGFLNHSCTPNATYDIIPAHTFKESDYYLDEALERDDAVDEADVEDDDTVEDVPATAAAGGSGGSGGDGGRHDKTGAVRSRDEDGENEEDVTAAAAGRAPERQEDQDASVAAHTATTDVVSGSTTTRNVAHLGERTEDYPDLTEADAPTYLFCCRATEDVKAGDEILISYIPPSWTFDNRQYVLHDRYHFWCKCPKCAPTLDKKYAKVPKMMIGIIVFCIFLQVLLLYQRDLKNAVDDEVEAIRALPEEERIEALRARGMNVNHFADEEYERRRRSRTKGFLEQLEVEKAQSANRFDDLRDRNPMLQKEMDAQGVKW